MEAELRHYSSIGNKAGILLFCKEVMSGERKDYASVKALCSFKNGVELNFNSAVTLFSYLGILIKQEDILFSSSFEFINDNQLLIDNLCILCFSKLIEEELLNINKIKFNEEEFEILAPKSAFKLEAAIFRNMLIELDAIILNDSNEFIFRKKYEHVFIDQIKKHRIKKTQEKLLKELAEKQKIGAEGELFVFQYEQLRLLGHPFLKNVRIISDIDISAGYDIISFKNIASLKIDNFIEVKTFIGKPHFYWSSNEISQARLRRENYSIYLIDYNKIGELNYKPEIICDPYATIIGDTNKWKLMPSTYEVIKL
jgi:hypothetical protein